MFEMIDNALYVTHTICGKACTTGPTTETKAVGTVAIEDQNGVIRQVKAFANYLNVFVELGDFKDILTDAGALKNRPDTNLIGFKNELFKSQNTRASSTCLYSMGEGKQLRSSCNRQ